MFNESPVSGIDGIVFDAVGTLIDPCPSVAEVYASTALRRGIRLDVGEVRARFHRYFRDDEVDEMRGPLETDEAIEYRRWRRIVASVIPEVPDPDAAFAELWAHFGLAGSWRCFPDVAPAIGFFRARGVPALVASNFDGRLRAVVSGLPELSGFEASLVISSEVGCRKPHPAFYRAACEALGLPPGRVLCVGDDPENDVEGPRRAGLRAALVDRHGRRPAGMPVLPDLAALADLWGGA
jgi:putative hydrolase of the HAD superfamily